MTSYSDSAGSLPANPEDAGWQWLQHRLKDRQTERLANWIDEQLVVLEEQFADLVTHKSRARSLRSQLQRDDSRS